MKTSFSYKHAELREPVEEEALRHIEKLGRFLQDYSPDLLQLHGTFEKHPRKVEYLLTLNLTLPAGTLHATGVGPDARSTVKSAFTDLKSQLKKHQEKLRKDYEWKRKRGRMRILAPAR